MPCSCFFQNFTYPSQEDVKMKLVPGVRMTNVRTSRCMREYWYLAALGNASKKRLPFFSMADECFSSCRNRFSLLCTFSSSVLGLFDRFVSTILPYCPLMNRSCDFFSFFPWASARIHALPLVTPDDALNATRSFRYAFHPCNTFFLKREL